MRRMLISAAVSALVAGSAFAADLPSRKGPPVLPPPPPPPPMWTGFYVGLNAGGTWAASGNITNTAFGIVPGPGVFPQPVLSAEAAASATSFVSGNNNGGFIGGGQIGYNFQFYNNFIVGLEADIQGIAGTSGSRSFIATTPSSFPAGTGSTFTTVGQLRGSLDYLGTVRGRLGWLFTPTLLVYGTGGFAYGGVSVNNAFVTSHSFGAFLPSPLTSFGASSFADTRTGWTAGGGLEWMFWPNWSAKVEYLYYDLGRITTTAYGFESGANTGGVQLWGLGLQTSARVNGNIVRAGVNYHFNWGAPAPVVAKY
ncbi:outer membrane beta-barrel protein [Methylocystis echinoides]|jgi:outer membrane immunogenic protein|uniref:outer membrane protein n=1 Tax=Methylocystis echinoides TaxID=29468 RepID=UPI00341DD843